MILMNGIELMRAKQRWMLSSAPFVAYAPLFIPLLLKKK
jgi:hypothetical protein